MTFVVETFNDFPSWSPNSGVSSHYVLDVLVQILVLVSFSSCIFIVLQLYLDSVSLPYSVSESWDHRENLVSHRTLNDDGSCVGIVNVVLESPSPT